MPSGGGIFNFDSNTSFVDISSQSKKLNKFKAVSTIGRSAKTLKYKQSNWKVLINL